nr:MAG TPA: hypothetical protein [Caudoviricetes sp.]
MVTIIYRVNLIMHIMMPTLHRVMLSTLYHLECIL